MIVAGKTISQRLKWYLDTISLGDFKTDLVVVDDNMGSADALRYVGDRIKVTLALRLVAITCALTCWAD